MPCAHGRAERGRRLRAKERHAAGLGPVAWSSREPLSNVKPRGSVAAAPFSSSCPGRGRAVRQAVLEGPDVGGLRQYSGPRGADMIPLASPKRSTGQHLARGHSAESPGSEPEPADRSPSPSRASGPHTGPVHPCPLMYATRRRGQRGPRRIPEAETPKVLPAAARGDIRPLTPVSGPHLITARSQGLPRPESRAG